MISLDEGKLASSSEDKTIKIWDYLNGRLVTTFDKKNGGHQTEVFSLISMGRGEMASGAGNISGGQGELKVWNVKNEKLEYSFDESNGGPNSRIYSFALLGNNDLVSGSVDKTIKVWDTSKSLGYRGYSLNIHFYLFCFVFVMKMMF